jgi:hypothetical protein
MSILGLSVDRTTVITVAWLLFGVAGISVIRRVARARREASESATVSERRAQLERLVKPR